MDAHAEPVGATEKPRRPTERHHHGERYHALRFLESVYRLLAWLALPAVPLAAVAYAVAGKPGMAGWESYTVVALIFGLILGGVLWVSLMTVGESIAVVCDTEVNTRVAAETLGKIADQLERATGADGSPLSK